MDYYYIDIRENNTLSNNSLKKKSYQNNYNLKTKGNDLLLCM